MCLVWDKDVVWFVGSLFGLVLLPRCFFHMVECEEIGRDMEIDGERDIATYLNALFANHMFPWHYIIEDLSTSSMWITIDRP